MPTLAGELSLLPTAGGEPWTTFLLGIALLAVLLAGASFYLGRRLHRHSDELDRVRQRLDTEQQDLDSLASALRESEASLDETRRALDTLVSNLPGIVYRCRIDDQWTMEMVAGECAELTGYDSSDLVENRNVSYAELVHPDDRERLWQELQAAVRDSGSFRITYRIRTATGEEKWVWEQGRAVSHTGNAVLEGFVTDVSEHKRVEDQLHHDSFHDRLTNLPNRALFMDRLERSLHRAQRHKNDLFAVLCLDLDRFKLVNDSLGHQLGDDLIVVVAARLQDCLGPEHTVARLGGDEFAILLEELEHPGDAVRIAERVDEVLRTPIVLGQHELFVTGSTGVALSASRYDRAEDLLRDAEIAMYRAKALGGGRHETFDRAMHQRAVSLLQLESDLRRAVRREEFELHYQPIVRLTDGRTAGFEALLRWHHPDRGLIAPAEFIPMAEETGLILPMGQWVLREACCQMKSWIESFPALDPLVITVNLSGRQFSQPDLVEQVAEILNDSGLEGSHLRLEITESVIMERAELTAAMLNRIKELEIQLSVDDFGTGYSSLSYLHRFPLDTLKIDRTFVGDMNRDRENLEIVRTIVTLAHSLGMNVVAEGVEAAGQARRVRSLGCEYAQGYFFAAPLAADAARKRLETEFRRTVFTADA